MGSTSDVVRPTITLPGLSYTMPITLPGLSHTMPITLSGLSHTMPISLLVCRSPAKETLLAMKADLQAVKVKMDLQAAELQVALQSKVKMELLAAELQVALQSKVKMELQAAELQTALQSKIKMELQAALQSLTQSVIGENATVGKYSLMQQLVLFYMCEIRVPMTSSAVSCS